MLRDESEAAKNKPVQRGGYAKILLPWIIDVALSSSKIKCVAVRDKGVIVGHSDVCHRNDYCKAK